jgi:hydroxymethylpyrimidine pyrophosphatase-like HAD family hydrolase
MDRYLKENSAYERLYAEYKKYGNLIVAVDFDDTLYDYHQSGNTYDKIQQLVRDLFDAGCQIIIWTGNPDEEMVAEYLDRNNIPFNTINQDIVTCHNKTTRKIYANVFIDDRAGLSQVYNDLTRLLKEIWKK